MYKKLFIFDLDGTLVNAYEAIEKSLNATRKRFGYSPVTRQEVKSKVGRGDRRFIEMFFKKEDAARAVRFYRSHHRSALVKYSRLMKDTRRTLASLERKGKIIAIASNRPKRFSRIIVETLKLKRYIDGLWCADEVKSLKPHPKILNVIMRRFAIPKHEVVYVGDMDIDIETAERASVDAVFVTGGSGTVAQIKKFKNKKIISCLSKLLALYN